MNTRLRLQHPLKPVFQPSGTRTLRVLGATLLALATAHLAGCGSGGEGPAEAASNRPIAASSVQSVRPTRPTGIDYGCDDAPFPSLKWTTCEVANFARTTQANLEQLQPAFLARSLAQSAINAAEWAVRAKDDPSWVLSTALNAPVLPACATGQGPCLGDPFAYPQSEGPNGRLFYETEGKVSPVVFYDRDCTRLAGQIWVPRTASANGRLPHIVFANGSVQAPQAVYVPFIQAYVRAGYAVLSYDPRGQGKSDQQSPDFKQGSNLGPDVFWHNLVDAIDFMHSRPDAPYPHQSRCQATYPTPTAAFNPAWAQIDVDRLGIAGHSLGAMGVSVVQGYGAPGAAPWPGRLSATNPVKAVVALDSLITPDARSLMPLNCFRSTELAQLASAQVIAAGRLPKFGIRAPSMSFSADYCGIPVPHLLPPDAAFPTLAFRQWQQAGVPAYSLTLQGTTHFDFAPTLALPATSWCPNAASKACENGWAIPAINHYSVAWFDRWLKNPGERGFDTADQRLVDDAGPQGAIKLSFRHTSARDFPDRSGQAQRCDNIRRGCVIN